MKNHKLVVFLFLIGISTVFAQQKKYITYKVTKGETIQSIAKKLFVTPYDLMKLNPDISSGISASEILIIPNKDYNPSKVIADVDQKTITVNDIVVDNYIYHNVLSKETLYSIQKKFKVSNAELNRLNPFLLKEGLKFGHVIKIPLQISEAEIVKKDETTQPYLVKPKETKYSIARTFNISIEFLEQLNPKIKELGLQIDDVILVPKPKDEELANFEEYQVEKLETLYSLSNKFEISQAELLAANPKLEEGVKEGMLLKIPKNEKAGDYSIFIEEDLQGKMLHVAMMLPFMVNQDTLNFENNRLLNITTDFYFGSLLALDSLKKQGLSIRMKVYDTENNSSISRKFSQSKEFSNLDAIIGPFFLKNVKVVSNNVKNKKPIVVSPISTKDHSGINNINLVQEVPTQEHLALEMLAYVKSVYSNQKLIVILDEDEPEENFKSLIRELQLLNIAPITFIKPKEGYIKTEIFKENIDENKENWILLLGNDGVIASDVVNNLGVLPEEINVTLFAFEKGRGFDKIDNNFLARINFHYPTFNFIDKESLELKYFDKKYRKKFGDYPSKYAIEGFDITYDILIRLAKDSNLINQGFSERLATRYNFIENTSNSILNKGIFIVKYEGLTLKSIK